MRSRCRRPPAKKAANIDLSVPLSKLHSVSGSLLAKDGHTINGGNVQLLHSDDREEVSQGQRRQREDKEFHFPYVPEDDYILSVPGAKDVTQVEVENAKGVTPHTHPEDKTVRTYGAAEQPLKVQTDMTGVLVNVPEKKESSPLKRRKAASDARSVRPRRGLRIARV